ncbi:MAG: hypothetical protein AAF666_05700 [Pseudomonadota bacterium]
MEFHLDFGETVAKAFSSLTPDLNGIYEGAKDSSLTSVRRTQTALAAGSGAISYAVPFLHVPMAAADLTVLINRMSVASYSIGAVKGELYGKGNVLEDEDFAIVLGLWCGYTDLEQIVRMKDDKEQILAMQQDAGAKAISRTVLKYIGAMTAEQLMFRIAGRLATRVGVRAGSKLTLGAIPVIGAAVGATTNSLMMDSLCDAAERYYDWKLGPATPLESAA